jgi:flagellar biosynthesis protein FlhB
VGKVFGHYRLCFNGLIVLLALFANTMLESMMGSSSYSGMGASEALTIAVVYIILAVIVFFMSLFLFRFGKGMKLAISQNDQEVLAKSFLNLKLYHRIAGILTVIYLVIIVFAIIIGVIAGVSRF